MSRPRLLTVNIPRLSDLENSYMPWLQRGGLFVPTAEPYHFGDTIYLLLSLPGHAEKFSADGEVVWIVPAANNRNLPPGIGVHLSDSEGSRKLKMRIETMIANQVS